MAQITQENRTTQNGYEEPVRPRRPPREAPSIPQRLNISFLYAEKDELFSKELSPYLQLLEDSKPWMRLKYHTVESLSPFGLRKLLDKTDMFLLAVSTDFLAASLRLESIFCRIMDFHRTGKLVTAALLMRNCRIGESLFKNAIRLPESLNPVNSPAWPTRDDAYLDIQSALDVLFTETLEKKIALEKSWQEARAIHTVECYLGFLRQYPHCRYAQEAKKLTKELEEKELWVQAEKQNDIPGYFRYLSHGPLQEKRFDAALKISEIEEDDDKNWLEAASHDNLGLYFRYRASFPEGRHFEEDEEALNQKLSAPALATERCDDNLQSNYLLKLACRRLPHQELFSLNAFLSYGYKLRNQREELYKAVQFRLLILAFSLFLLFIFVLWLYPALRAPEFPRGSISLITWVVTLVFIAGFTLRRIVFVYHHFRCDFKMLKEADEILKRGLVLLKVAFLNNEPQKAEKILIRLRQVERALYKVQANGLGAYLLSSEFTEPLVKEGYVYAA